MSASQFIIIDNRFVKLRYWFVYECPPCLFRLIRFTLLSLMFIVFIVRLYLPSLFIFPHKSILYCCR